MRRIILVISLFFSNLQSYSLIDFYRENGNANLQKRAEELLKSSGFWEKRLETLDVEFGYYEDIDYLIIVNKSFQSLDLYKMERNHQFNLIQTVDVIIGENRGVKELEGDKKTPTGVYQLTQKLNKLDPFYGPLALVTSYPNLKDKLEKRTGSGIWIHGFPMNGERELFTKGCVAMENNRLIQFDELLKSREKTLLILEDGRLERVSKSDLALILSSLYKWLDSWRDGKFEEYISFYSKDFKRYDGKEIDWFINYKRRIFKKVDKKEIFFTNINISPYPNSEKRNLFRITLHEKYRSSTTNFDGEKELFIEIENNQMKIIIEN